MCSQQRAVAEGAMILLLQSGFVIVQHISDFSTLKSHSTQPQGYPKLEKPLKFLLANEHRRLVRESQHWPSKHTTLT